MKILSIADPQSNDEKKLKADLSYRASPFMSEGRLNNRITLVLASQAFNDCSAAFVVCLL